MSSLFKRLYAAACYGLWLPGLLMTVLAAPPSLAMGSKPAKTVEKAPAVPELPKELEALLARTLQDVRDNRLDDAMRGTEAMLKGYPHFRLAYLIRGDLLLSRARPLSGIGNAPGAAQQLADLREEIHVRLQHLKERIPEDRIPKNLLQFQPGQRHAVVVDTSKARLYLFENHNGEARYLANYYTSIGKAGAEKMREGDQKTPLGMYFVVANLPRSQLTDFYGVGAFPINYPNEWDRKLGRNGHGIWLHGVPSDTYSRPPRSSNGCVVLSNPDMTALGKNLQVGLTPVIISERVEWVAPKALAARREALNRALETWRGDWESLDDGRYLRHYSQSFFAPGQDHRSWSEQKRLVNAGKSWVKVKLSNVSLFSYPGDDGMVVATFDQDYDSNNLKNQMRKRQYWKEENGVWRIIYEGSA